MGIEGLLLSEWESRGCDEVFRRCEEVYAEQSPSLPHVDVALQILQAATDHAKAWRGHTAACERAVSVLIAALNAVLRSHRNKNRAVLVPLTPVSSDNKRGAKERLGRILREIRRRALKKGVDETTPQVPPLADLAMAAAESSSLAEFCHNAQVTDGPSTTTTVCNDMLTSFAGAFEREGAQLCAIIAEVYFAKKSSQEIKNISFHSRRHKDSEGGSLTNACNAAVDFLSETCGDGPRAMFSGLPPLFGRLTCDAVIRFLCHCWIRQFCRRPPRLSGCPTLPLVISADASTLLGLAKKWGADARWNGVTSNPLGPMQEVCSMIRDPSSELMAMCTARLEVALGDELGSALAEAARRAASR